MAIQSIDYFNAVLRKLVNLNFTDKQLLEVKSFILQVINNSDNESPATLLNFLYSGEGEYTGVYTTNPTYKLILRKRVLN